MVVVVSWNMTPRNQDLYHAIKSFLLAFSRLIAERSETLSQVKVDEAEPSDAIEQVRQLPEYQKSIDQLQNDPVIAGHFGNFVGTAVTGGYGGLTASDALERLIGPIPEGKRPVFDEQYFERGYQAFEDTFYNSSFECEAIAPIQGWFIDGALQEQSVDHPLVRFSDDLEISRLTEDEERQVHMLELVRRYGPRWTDRIYAIRAKYKLPKVNVKDQAEIPPEEQESAKTKVAEIDERIGEVLQALRIYKEGNIRQGGIAHRVNDWLVGGPMIIASRLLADPMANFFPLYTLDDAAQLDDLKLFWQSVQSVKAKGKRFINVAARRFCDGCGRLALSQSDALNREGIEKMRMPAYIRALCVSLLLASLCLHLGCARQSSTGQGNAPEINVAAAANLTDAFAEVAKQFTAETGVRVVYSFGATADLAKQIENGAPFDLFAAADVEHVNGLDRQGLLTPGTRALFARGRLVVWTPPGSGINLSRIEDITRAEVGRIAIAKPDVAPYGKATVEALRALNLWQQVESKVVYAQNVSMTKQFAATGNAEVAFLPLALVKPNEGRLIEVDERLHQPIDQALGVVKASAKQEAARQFKAFVLSIKGQAILESCGYRKP
jgi:molybdate transport system substrate-binding protein